MATRFVAGVSMFVGVGVGAAVVVPEEAKVARVFEPSAAPLPVPPPQAETVASTTIEMPNGAGRVGL